MNFCIPEGMVQKFLQQLKSGDLNPGQLAEMTSAERRAAFEKTVGADAAHQVNALFESKLLLKNQQRGMITWAKDVAGLNPAVRRDLLAKIQRLDKVLTPEDQARFLEDLVNKRLGVGVDAEEAKRIAELAQAVEDTRGATDRLVHGRAKVALSNYVNDLKEAAGKTSLKEKITSPGDTLSKAAGLSKSIKASLDNSAIFRQGWKSMFTNPVIWGQNAAKSFADFARTVGGAHIMDEVNADIVSRPTYDLMKKAKLAVGTIEEAYPSQLPEKIPGIGRFFKASENAYTAFMYRQRADIFDKYIVAAEKAGVNLKDPKELEKVGNLVNALTGRGNLGKAEKAADAFNNVFFSPRFFKSHIDVLTQPLTGGGKVLEFTKGSNFVRKQAANNLAKMIAGQAALLAIANSVRPGSVEFDPRSSDFGKIRIGSTRFDVSGGSASAITLATRLVKMSTKSTTTKKVTPLNSGKFGSQTGTDVIYSFLENKLSPVGGVIRDLLRGEDFNGNKPTLGSTAANLTVPLPITNYLNSKDEPGRANLLLIILADALGVGANTYSSQKKK